MTDAQEQPQQHREQLGAELRRLRTLAGLSQEGIHRELDISKSTVNRIESGKGGGLPSWKVVKAWAEACAATSSDLDYLRTLTEYAGGTRPSYEERGSWADVQEGARRDEADAMTMRNFANWGIPGLLQTPEYARDALRLADLREAGGIDEAVSARMSRPAILSDQRRDLQFLVTEGALRFQPGPLNILQNQLSYLLAVITWPTVAFRAIPDAGEAKALRLVPFVLFEDRLDGQPPWVSVEMPHDEARLTTAKDVALYRTLFDKQWETALAGDEAAAFVRQIATSLS